MLGCILLIAIVIAGVMVMFGLNTSAKRVVFVVFVVALVAPIVQTMVGELRWVRLGWLAWLAVPVFLGALVAAFISFTNHRRGANRWLGKRKTAAKTRRDSDDA